MVPCQARSATRSERSAADALFQWNARQPAGLVACRLTVVLTGLSGVPAVRGSSGWSKDLREVLRPPTLTMVLGGPRSAPRSGGPWALDGLHGHRDHRAGRYPERRTKPCVSSFARAACMSAAVLPCAAAISLLVTPSGAKSAGSCGMASVLGL